MPLECPGVPSEILNPKNTWRDPDAYDAKASYLSQIFKENFQQFESFASADILSGGPN
jgi:phosphoenolpyruvate carboxykinase (ATP)